MGQEMWLGHALKKAKKEEKLRDVTSHIFAQTTHVVLPHALPLPKLLCGCCPRCSQPCQVEIGSGFWFPDGSKAAIFLCLALWHIYIIGSAQPMINTSTQWSYTATLFRMQRQTLYNNRLVYNAHNVFRCSSRWKVHITLNSIYFFSLTLKCDLVRNHNETSTSLLWYHRRQYRRLWNAIVNNWPFTAQWDWDCVTECRWLVFTELSVPTLSCASTIHTTYTDHQQWVDR